MFKNFFSYISRADNFIQVGIILIIILILHNFAVSLYSNSALRERNAFLDKRMATLESIDALGTNVNLIDLGVRGFFMIPEEKLKEPLEIARKQHRLNMDTLKARMKDLHYPHMDSLDLVDRWINDYISLADQGIENIRNGESQQTAQLYARDPGYTLWSKYSKVQASMRRYVNHLETQSLRDYQQINLYAFISQLTLLCLGTSVLLYVIYKLSHHDAYIRQLFRRIQESDKAYIFNNGKELDEKDNEQVIEHMEDNLRRATTFIQSITKGNLDVRWEGLNKSIRDLNKDTLAGELITMRDQMAHVREEEGHRMWISEGISRFSEIVRNDQENLTIMSDKLLSGIVKYMDCNQGGLFFVDKDDQDQVQLQLTSCFAYDKKKFMERKVPVDVGLLGQAFTEGEMVILKEIPENYIQITSGLGEATPHYLAIIPLKVNDSTEGVLELASFTPFTEVQKELLLRVSEIVASAVFTSRNSEKMRILLEQAQQTTEEMRAQEEEMRQNMEELQATQEEMARKEKEHLRRIMELEASGSTITE